MDAVSTPAPATGQAPAVATTPATAATPASTAIPTVEKFVELQLTIEDEGTNCDLATGNYNGKSTLETKLKEIHKQRTISFKNCSRGSVIQPYTVTISQDSDRTTVALQLYAAFLNKQIHDNLTSVQVVLNGQSVNLTNPCQVYDILNYCQNSATCKVENNLPACQCVNGYSGVACSDKETDNKALIVALSACLGVASFIFVVVLIGIVCKYHAGQKYKRHRDSPNVSDNSFARMNTRSSYAYPGWPGQSWLNTHVKSFPPRTPAHYQNASGYFGGGYLDSRHQAASTAFYANGSKPSALPYGHKSTQKYYTNY